VTAAYFLGAPALKERRAKVDRLVSQAKEFISRVSTMSRTESYEDLFIARDLAQEVLSKKISLDKKWISRDWITSKVEKQCRQFLLEFEQDRSVIYEKNFALFKKQKQQWVEDGLANPSSLPITPKSNLALCWTGWSIHRRNPLGNRCLYRLGNKIASHPDQVETLMYVENKSNNTNYHAKVFLNDVVGRRSFLVKEFKRERPQGQLTC
jgi:hypothetical protein